MAQENLPLAPGKRLRGARVGPNPCGAGVRVGQEAVPLLIRPETRSMAGNGRMIDLSREFPEDGAVDGKYPATCGGSPVSDALLRVRVRIQVRCGGAVAAAGGISHK
jgi:hypothetical protein